MGLMQKYSAYISFLTILLLASLAVEATTGKRGPAEGVETCKQEMLHELIPQASLLQVKETESVSQGLSRHSVLKPSQPSVSELLPGQDSAPVWIQYDFGTHPKPEYKAGGVCGSMIACYEFGPCWHAQQLVTFADDDYLYTFSTMSASKHGIAYLLKAPLVNGVPKGSPSKDREHRRRHAPSSAISSSTSFADADGSSLGSPPGDGSVQWYELQTEFNHPGDVVIKDRIILTAGQNWDPAADIDKKSSTSSKTSSSVAKEAAHSGNNCEADLPSSRQALVIWDFRNSLESPEKHIIDKSKFNDILETQGKMDETDADDLSGGDVDGHLIINFENKWLRWKGTPGASLGSVADWAEIIAPTQPWCNSDGALAGKLFVRFQNTEKSSYLATFVIGKPCYTLYPVQFNESTSTLSVTCSNPIEKCTQGGQIVEHGKTWHTGPKAFQTITGGKNGQIYVTSINLGGDETKVLSSASR